MFPSGCWTILGGLWSLLVFAGLIWLIVWTVSRRSGQPCARTTLDIARERYARGEISHKEFEQLKKDLA